MHRHHSTPKRLALLGALSLMLVAGCATRPQPLYNWGSYQPSVYQYLKGDGAEVTQQISKLESELQETKVAGMRVPPGLHGHLALLYNLAGDANAARKHLELERQLFPESGPYLDRLLMNSALTEGKSR
jgi:hypothetical protein